MSQLATIQDQIYALESEFKAAQVDQSMSFAREAGFALQVLLPNDYAMGIARQNPQSVRNAVINIAAIGISLNPAKKQAYLVPRDGKICLDISYMGLIDMATDSGSVLWAQSAIVHQKDQFELMGLDKPPSHKFNPFDKERGDIVGAYVTVKTKGGDYLTHAMPIDAIHAIRDRSVAYRAFIQKKKLCPWVTDEGEMIKKTVVKQAHKYWPRSERLDAAIHYADTDGGEGIEVEPQNTNFRQSATQGAIVDEARKPIILAVAEAIKDRFEADDMIGAYEEYIDITDGEEKTMLWGKLPSHIKTALRKHGETLKGEK
jgi:recombination protein RecT